MSKYYCHKCAEIIDLLPANTELNYTGSIVQLDKFIKHTMPTASYKINSVFQTNDYDQFKNYMVNSICSGSVEIDNLGRMNIVWVAGEKTGTTYLLVYFSKLLFSIRKNLTQNFKIRNFTQISNNLFSSKASRLPL
ncbi:MAG TPA: hypothetical protein DCR48_11370 [Flavobacteriales bacterium]|nr:hypothetical protein [Flavobacteriales bacterium]